MEQISNWTVLVVRNIEPGMPCLENVTAAEWRFPESPELVTETLKTEGTKFQTDGARLHLVCL